MPKNHEFNGTVRNAVREDMDQVYKLIKALAEYEKLGDRVAITHKTLQEDGFDSKNPAFSCIVAESSDGHIIGFALYYYCYSTWIGKSIFLEDLFVEPAHRKSGIGKQLITAVAKIAQENHVKRFDFHVLSWNPAIEFYKRLGATNISQTEEWALFRMDQDGINRLLC